MLCSWCNWRANGRNYFRTARLIFCRKILCKVFPLMRLSRIFNCVAILSFREIRSKLDRIWVHTPVFESLFFYVYFIKKWSFFDKKLNIFNNNYKNVLFRPPPPPPLIISPFSSLLFYLCKYVLYDQFII